MSNGVPGAHRFCGRWGSGTIDGASYTLDSAGNRTAKTDQLANVTSNYTYDPLYELTQVTQASTTTENYSYDPVGNRTASLGVSSYTTNSSNEMTANSNASYTYDYNGNTTSKTVSSATTNYTWDYENRLASVTLPSSGGTVSFKYDPFGRRIEKISPNATSIFVYDGNDLIETVNALGSTVARYARGIEIDEPLAMERGSTTDYYEQDGVGSVTSLTASNGSVAQAYTYDSFGNTTDSSGSLTNFFRYTDRDFDNETGLYFLRARYFDPTIGRFISEDPIRFLGGIDFYTYVKNRPLNYRDPSGLAPDWNWLWKWGNNLRKLGRRITCIADCVNCITPTCENSKSIGQAQGGGPPVYTPNDLANPVASEGVRQIQQAVSGNSNCKECINNCVSEAPAIGMFPQP